MTVSVSVTKPSITTALTIWSAVPVRRDLGEEVKRRILLGTYVLSAGYYDAYYKKAQNLRGTIVKAFNNAFEKCDVILAPTVPMTAFEKGHAVSDPIETYLTDICTVPVNIAGLPGVSVPCGFNAKGMPIGMQLIGRASARLKFLMRHTNISRLLLKTLRIQSGVLSCELRISCGF